MTKKELSEILHSTGVPVNEGISSAVNTNKYPRIVYWPYYEQDEQRPEKDIRTLSHIKFPSMQEHHSTKNTKNLERDFGNWDCTQRSSMNMWKKMKFLRKHGTHISHWT